MRSKELPLPLSCRWLTWVAVVPLEEGTEVLRDQAGVSADQGRTGQKVRVPHELLAAGESRYSTNCKAACGWLAWFNTAALKLIGLPEKVCPALVVKWTRA